MKPGSYTQLYVQLIFAVKFRDACLTKSVRERVFSYIAGIIREMDHKPIIVNGVEDHIHILIGLNTNKSISDTVHTIKRTSSLFINKEKLCLGKFAWQEGYAAYSYSRSQLNNVYNYILNQAEHHRKVKFRDEYIGFLTKFEVEFDERFLFDFLDDA
jgi:putative transposase